MNDEVRQLEERIRYHQKKYYGGEADISDADFDSLWERLAVLDPDNPLLRGVGSEYAASGAPDSDTADGFPKVAHVIPMGSQDKASDPASFLKWAAKVAHPSFITQYKLDGASIELVYEDGRFVRGVTRGDGAVGDDVTDNAARMRGCVKKIDADFSGAVRGEVLMSHETHDAHFPDKANCRNAANGIMKRKDGLGCEMLEIVAYDAGRTGDDLFFASELAKIAWLERQGFAVVPCRVFATAGEVVDFRAATMEKRPSYAYDIDGLVVKGDAIDPEDMKRARPEKQIAFKFSLEEAISVLRAVEWSESGSLYTPIGIIDPVKIAGTTVKRANLCNPAMLAGLNLRIGSRIIITKRGEIIPKIEGLVENPPDAGEISMPDRCGTCHSSLINEGTRLYCPDPSCGKKTLHRLMKWIDVIGVKDFGGVIIEKLYGSGRVKGIADLYSLSAEELAEYERMGDKLARKILRNLSAVAEVSLPRFIAGFDIEGIGELMAQKAVAAGFDTLEKIRGSSVEVLASVEGFGEITARAVLGGLAAFAGEMDALLATGKIRIPPPVAAGPLAGTSFCFTGELVGMKRDEAERRVRDLGGTAKNSVTSDLSYLVTNDPGSGSSKNAKARRLGIPVIGENEFLEILEGKKQ